jgi:uncharacterized membrane protein (DUF2068 family)
MAETQNKRAPTLYIIIGIKLFKGILLLLVGLGVYSLAGRDLQEQFDRFLRWVSLDPEKKFFSDIGAWLDTITATNVKWVATGTLLYSLFSLVEGIGLIFRVSWAGWMAIGESAFFIPIEIYELLHHFSWTVLVIMLLNIVIVWYIYQNRERLFKHH